MIILSFVVSLVSSALRQGAPFVVKYVLMSCVKSSESSRVKKALLAMLYRESESCPIFLDKDFVHKIDDWCLVSRNNTKFKEKYSTTIEYVQS